MSDLASALAALQADLPPIRHTQAGQHGKYAAYDKILAIVRPIMAKHGFMWSTRPGLLIVGDGPASELRFVLRYDLTHIATGEAIQGAYPLAEGPPQQQGAVITYARRYCLTAVLDLAIEGEDSLDVPTRRPVRGAKVTGAEHERLRHGTVEATPEDRPAERTRPGDCPVCGVHLPQHAVGCPEVDAWQGQPPGPYPVPADSPGSILPRQMDAIQAKFRELGIEDRSVRLGIVQEALGLSSLRSSKDLTYSQAGQLLEALANMAGKDGSR